MRQRVAFLRTLLAGRPVLLLDEPFGALDSITRAAMQEWLAGALAAEPRTVVLVTHDVEEALFLADRVAVLSPRPGRVVAELAVDLPRPRRRRDAVTDPEFAGGCARRSMRSRAPQLRRTRPARRPAARGLRGRVAGRGLAALRRRPHARLARPRRCSALGDDWSLLLDNAWVTLEEVLLGLAIAVVAGVALAVGDAPHRPLRDAAYPLLVASQAIPIVVLAPIFVLAFDYGIGPKLAIVALICFFPITVNVLDGLRSAARRAAEADAQPRRLPAPDAAQGRAARRAAVVLQRPAGGRHHVGDRRRLRRVGGGRRGPRPPGAARQQPAADAAGVRRDRAAHADGGRRCSPSSRSPSGCSAPGPGKRRAREKRSRSCSSRSARSSRPAAARRRTRSARMARSGSS